MPFDDRDYSRGGSFDGPGGGLIGVLYALQRLFNWSWHAFTVDGIAVRVHILWFLFVGIYLLQGSLGGAGFFPTIQWIALLFVSVLLHEFGHCYGCRRVGGQADNILMWPLGGLAFCDAPRRPWAEFVTVACGPLVNVVLAVVSAVVVLIAFGYTVSLNPFGAPWYDTGTPYFEMPWIGQLLADLFRVNYWLLLFNLLLVFYPFDGGRLVQIGLWKRMGYAKSMYVATTVGLYGAGLVALIGLVRVFSGEGGGGGGLLVMIAIFGALACYQQRQALRYADEYDASEAWKTGGGTFASVDGGQTDDFGPKRNQRRKGWLAKRRESKAVAREKREREALENLSREMDRILEKVSKQGLDALTPAERKTLEQATKREKQYRSESSSNR